MRIAIPISHVDAPRLPLLVDVLAYLGGLEDHYLYLCPTPSQRPKAEEAGDALRAICNNVTVAPLANDIHGRWPSAANNHFALMAMAIAQLPEEMPWLNLETDAIPDQPTWIDRIATGLQNAGRVQYMGHRIDTAFKTQDGIVTPEGDHLMLGVAVYAHKMALDPAISFELTDLAFGDRTQGLPYDWYLRNCFKRLGFAHTDLIADQWNTGNYRVEDGALRCDALPAPEHAKNARPRGGQVDVRSVLVHGCKDGTLQRLVLEGKVPTYAPPRAASKSEPIRITARTYGAPPESDPLMVLLAQQQLMMAQMAESQRQTNALLAAMVQKQSPASEPTLNEVRNPGSLAQSQEDADTLNAFRKAAEAPDLDKIRAVLSEKSKRLNDIATETGIDIEDVRALITHSEDLVITPGPAGWVKRKEAVAVPA